MPQYVGFSTINACQPRSTNQQMLATMNNSVNINGMNVNGYGIPSGVGGPGQPNYNGAKFTLTDSQIVLQDFLNALNIRIGTVVGQPQLGTTLWNFIFEPNTQDVQNALVSEIRRVASQDPRLHVNTVVAFPQENGILVEVQFSVVPFNNPQLLNVFFNQQTGVAAPA